MLEETRATKSAARKGGVFHSGGYVPQLQTKILAGHELAPAKHPKTKDEFDSEFKGAIQTPGIDYLHGDELLKWQDRWYDEIEEMTRAEPHLLVKTWEDLEPAVREDRIVVAIDRMIMNH